VNRKSVLIAGGGTGGHISPGIAIYEEFKKNGVKCIFLAGKKDMGYASLGEIAADDLIFYGAPTLTRNIFKLPSFVLKFMSAVWKTKDIIKKYNIGAVIGMGGYVSAPALMAAKSRNIPIFLCEQNSVPGKVTRSFEKHAVCVFGTFNDAVQYLKFKDKYMKVGNPIREKVMKTVSKEEAKKAFHLSQSKKVVLIIGGSQGAVTLNELALGLKKNNADDLRDVGFIWSTGDFSYARYMEKIQSGMNRGQMYISPFIDKVGLAYRACDLAISRAGAGVMVELAALGVPSILIPYPHAAADHQNKNADEFVREGAAVKVKNEDAVIEKFTPVFFKVLGDQRRLAKMSECALAVARPDAASSIVKEIIKVV
jgi:UDP-N-acetylglucosamine--N-acetylmuramyl-(pentapeptide) pyrophosphoryl-undecaprenol N-acetylglucosamine transferase